MTFNQDWQLAMEQLLAVNRHKIINLSYLDYSSFPSLLEEKKVQRAFVNIFKYPDYHPNALGDEHARRAIAGFYQKQGQPLNVHRLLLTSSINHALSLLFKLFSLTGKPILCPAPRSPQIDEAAAFVGAKLIDYPLLPDQNWEIDLEALEKLLSKGAAALMVMSPHFPTGSVVTETKARELLQLTEQYQVPVIANEVYSDLYFGKDAYFSLADEGQTPLLITLNSITHFLALPGLKLSWLTVHGSEELAAIALDSLEKLEDTFLTVNQLSQEILPEILKYSANFQAKFHKHILRNKQLVERLITAKSGAKISTLAGGLGLLLRIPGLDAEKVALYLLKQKHYYVHPGNIYQAPGQDYLMISLLQKSSQLKAGINTILKLLRRPDASLVLPSPNFKKPKK